MNSPYTQHTLPNGLRVVIETMPDVRSAAAGFLVRTGARDETRDLAGVSHFLEHMMFKGTPNRTWRDITIDFDRMGSTYNAFTSEDCTVYYGWVRQSDIEKQIALLADMMRSEIPEEEFGKERKVILEEIAMAKDSLEHLAFDFIQDKLFAGHPLAWPILGYEDTVADMSRDALWQYFQRRYAPDNMILIVAGNVDPNHIIDVADKLCGGWAASGTDSQRQPPTMKTGTDVFTLDRFNQQIIALSFPSVSSRDELCETAGVAASILGGDNSRFFWNIVQEGIAPRVGAHCMDYTDFGVMILYGSCQPEGIPALYDAIKEQADKITRDGVKPEEVERVKNKRRTGLAVEAETPYHRLTQLMDDMEQYGEPRTVDQRLAEVDAVTVDSIANYFEAYPINIGGHLASVGPSQWPNTEGEPGGNGVSTA